MLIKEDLQGFVQKKLGDYLFVVVSNRQPYEHVYKKGKIECQRPSGGVITALDPVMQACHGLWIAASSGETDHRVIKDKFAHIEVIGLSVQNEDYVTSSMKKAGAIALLNKAGDPKELIQLILNLKSRGFQEPLLP